MTHSKGNRDRARVALLQAIENQIRAADPPETGQTLARLMKEGFSRKESIRYIACALMTEVTGVLRDESQYDQERYVANLKRLPKLPWEGEPVKQPPKKPS